MGHRKKKRLPKKLKRLMIVSISGIILVGILLFGAIFFTANVEVVGNSRYTVSEIKRMVMKGPLSWNTLLMSKFKEHIEFDDIAFMESVDVEYLNHNTIRLHVSEKYPIGYVEYEEKCYYFDKDGMVLESEDKQQETPAEGSESGDQSPIAAEAVEEESSKPFHPELTDVPLITGLEFQKAEVGKKLDVADDSIFNTILGLARMFDKYAMEPDSVEIDENKEFILHYVNVRVALGKDENLEDKMTRVAGILPKLAGESGVLHLEAFTKETQNIIFDKDQ